MEPAFEDLFYCRSHGSYIPNGRQQHVNIFLLQCVCITICVPAYCEHACFAMQNSGFCRVKGWFLRYKTVGFVVQKVFS